MEAMEIEILALQRLQNEANGTGHVLPKHVFNNGMSEMSRLLASMKMATEVFFIECRSAFN